MAEKTYAKEDGNEELWKTIFADGHPDLMAQHKSHLKLPAEPRCRMCKVPFSGLGGLYMRLIKKKKASSRNPHYCNACDGFLDTFPGGAEVEMSVLFADIRSSTQFADGAEAQAVSERINRFLDETTQAITDGDGFIMAFYGDCIVAVWPPGFSGANHAEKAVQTAQKLAHRMRDNAADIPVGVGVHTGGVYIGTVQAAKGSFRDVSIFGINVNIAARLSSEAKAGEVLASRVTVEKSNVKQAGEVQSLTLKGISEPVEAMAVH